MPKKPISRVEVAGAFWKDLAAWRRHPDCDAIRRDIARLVLARAQGLDGGDAPFTRGDMWDGIHHAHICSKLIVFTGYPEEGTLKLCALVKHDAYGFRNERKSLATTFAARMQRLLDVPSVPRPEWTALKWRDPGDIARHPELREMSRDGLEALYNEILDEQESFELLQRRSAEMSSALAAAFEEAWVLALIEEQEVVQRLILERVRPRPPHLEPHEFETWAPSP